MLESLKDAKRSGTPLVLIGTSDQWATLDNILKVYTDRAVLVLDRSDGLRGANDDGQSLAESIMSALPETTDQVDALIKFVRDYDAAQQYVLVLLGADRIVEEVSGGFNPAVSQAIANCRNPFKANGRTLILLAPTLMKLPTDIGNDTYQIEDPVASEEQRIEIVKQTFTDAELPVPTNGELTSALSATRGLSAYASEQIISLSMSKKGLDQNKLRNLWAQSINGIDGLEMERANDTVADIGGLEGLKSLLNVIKGGRRKIPIVVRIEEIEKMFAGNGSDGGPGDSSGTTQGILGKMLTFMEEQHSLGIILLGVAGCGKSLISRALGSVLNVPTLTFDANSIKDSLVGNTEKNLDRVLNTLKAIAGENIFFIASCNRATNLPGSLIRRFTCGRWFCDIPTKTEQEAIWQIMLKKYEGVKDVRPDYKDWTGAEIRNCVQNAYDWNITPAEAGKFIIPTVTADADELQRLRKEAHNRYFSASTGKVYQFTGVASAPISVAGRKLSLN